MLSINCSPIIIVRKIGEKAKEKFAKWLALMLLALVRIFYELLSRAHEDGQPTGSQLRNVD